MGRETVAASSVAERVWEMAGLRLRVVGTAGVLVFLAFCLGACSGGGSGGAQGSGGGDSGSDQVMEEDVASGAGSSGELAESAAGSAGGDLAESAGSGDDAAALPEDFDRRIIRSAELGIRAEDVRASAARAGDLAEQFGGSVLESNVNEDGDDGAYADLVISVPAQEFENVLDELRALPGKVTTDSVSGQDVTEEFVDLESRERNLLAAEASLLKLYERAESVEDTLVVERELTNVRGQIEQAQGRIKFLESRTEFSRISLSVTPVPKPVDPAWQPSRVAADAWEASLAVLQGAATAIITVLVFGWWFVPILVMGAVLWKRHRWSLTQSPPD